jgi:hypothetical protein
MMFNLSSAVPTTAPAIEGDDKPAAPNPQPRTADAFKKLRRLLGFIYLNGPMKWGFALLPVKESHRFCCKSH